MPWVRCRANTHGHIDHLTRHSQGGSRGPARTVPTGPAITANEKGPERQRVGWGTKRRQLSPAGVSVDLA